MLVSNCVVLELGFNRFSASADYSDREQPAKAFAGSASDSWPQPTLTIPTGGMRVVGHMSLIIICHGAAFNQGELSSSGFLHCALRGSL